MRRSEELDRVAVVIPSWNLCGDLRACLDSLAKQEGVEKELLVVDNGSRDGTLEFLREAGVPHVSLPRNLGFAAAVNLGVLQTRSPLVMILNEDTVVEPGCLSRLASELAEDSSLGGVQPKILELVRGPDRRCDDPDAVVYSLGQWLTRDGRALEDGAGGTQGAVPIWPREIFGVCGAACLLRRELLTSLGGYEERYFAFYEDVDLNVRARIAGWHFRLVPEAAVWHVGNAAWRAGFRRPGAQNARMVARNRLATQLKFMPARSVPKIAAVEIGALARSLLERRFFSTLGGKLEALRMMPALLRTRRKLDRDGQLDLAADWLGIGWTGKKTGIGRKPERPAMLPLPRRGAVGRPRVDPELEASSGLPRIG